MTTPDPAVEAPAVEVSPAQEGVETSQPTKPEIRGPSEIVPNVLIDDLRESHTNRGVLIPLKTTQEVRQDHTITHAFITRAPTKQANEVITFVHPDLQLHHHAAAQDDGC
jgi:tRNA-specific adenosine deaminase 3